ncbi:MAG: ubiquinol-cytochrome c reductase iron-sulfur subunit [Acidobacteriota bacterium]
MTVKPGALVSRLDPEPIPRRDVLGLLSLWSMASALLFATIGMLRLPKAAVLASPSKKVRLTLPDTLGAGEPYVPPGRSLAVFRDAEGVYAISTICTHLGCIVHASVQGFDCPCHGSGFLPDGSVRKGPAPRPLDWLKVTPAGASVVVDESVTVPPGTKVRV